jgi:hypothetical protein
MTKSHGNGYDVIGFYGVRTMGMMDGWIVVSVLSHLLPNRVPIYRPRRMRRLGWPW